MRPQYKRAVAGGSLMKGEGEASNDPEGRQLNSKGGEKALIKSRHPLCCE
jgi:hypothetical protein